MLHNLSESNLLIQHRRCIDNWRYASISKECGCFKCLAHFDASEITHWYESPNEKTAACPHCKIDAVIMETEHMHVEHDLLCQLNAAFFESSNGFLFS
jgi:hypothetical protein